MQQVLAKGLDGEDRAVAAPTSALPVALAHPVEGRGNRLRRLRELTADHCGVLRAIGVGDRRGVLVPVLEHRIHLRTHEVHAGVEDAAYVADMAAVLQRRPHPRLRPHANIDSLEDRPPAGGTGTQPRSDLAAGPRGGVEATVGARLLQNPRPVLVVWLDDSFSVGRFSGGGHGLILAQVLWLRTKVWPATFR